MSRKVKGRVKVNIPWFQRQHYDTIKRLVPDRPMANTFDEWLEGTTAYITQAQARGVIVKTVVIDPDQFVAYCRKCGANHVKTSLGNFAVIMARKQREQGVRAGLRRSCFELPPLAGAGSNSSDEKEKAWLRKILSAVITALAAHTTMSDQEVENAVDASQVLRVGDGPTAVYAYGYRCARDRLKIGLTEGDTVQRIAAQIGPATPDKPQLILEIKTSHCRSLERALHSILEHRGRKIPGAGEEWFRTDRDELMEIYRFIVTRERKS